MPAARGFPSPVVKGKVAHWTAGIRQGMMAVPPPWFFPLILWKKGKLSKQVFVEEGRRTLKKNKNKKHHSRGLFPTEGRVLKVWKTPSVRKSTFKGGRGRSSLESDARRCAPPRLREVSPRGRRRAPPLGEARAPAPQPPGLLPL